MVAKVSLPQINCRPLIRPSEDRLQSLAASFFGVTVFIPLWGGDKKTDDEWERKPIIKFSDWPWALSIV